MRIVISPAKSLNFSAELPNLETSSILFSKDAQTIDKVLKTLKPNDLSQLMSISDKLADLNWQRNQERDLDTMTSENARPAVFAFDGDVYNGLDVYTLDSQKIDALQSQLRILSGLYGLLKPLDLIQPYRLEMGTKISIGKHKSLYEFWKSKITDQLNSELEDNSIFLNLASKEYFDAIDIKKLKATVITPEFKDYSNGKLKIISFYAKKARGLMVRYIIDTEAKTIEALKKFNYEGYVFDENLSSKTKLVFTR
jgi:cytoplasmic iron level regulating protein YaaA (DUF328/UPF0246 family)